jgi:hypothetical protein
MASIAHAMRIFQNPVLHRPTTSSEMCVFAMGSQIPSGKPDSKRLDNLTMTS